jgi:transcriptional accessory protein Tex/SPT6
LQKISNLKNWLKETIKSDEFEKIKNLDEKEIILGALEILSNEITQNTKLRDLLKNNTLKNGFIISKIK